MRFQQVRYSICATFGHRPTVRPPFKGWAWLAPWCRRCHKYPCQTSKWTVTR